MTRYDVYDFDHRLVPSPDGAWVRFEEVPQWQPIESAPKDGALVLGFMHYYGVDYWGQLRWESFADGSAGWVGGSFLTNPPGSFHAFMQPTHWQPWPLPPSPTPPRGETP